MSTRLPGSPDPALFAGHERLLTYGPRRVYLDVPEGTRVLVQILAGSRLTLPAVSARLVFHTTEHSSLMFLQADTPLFGSQEPTAPQGEYYFSISHRSLPEDREWPPLPGFVGGLNPLFQVCPHYKETTE